MSSDSREERERLKEEYKQHYRKMRETKERLTRVKRTHNITEALRNMDTTELMDSFDDFLFNMKSRIASVEARLEVAMDSLDEDDERFERVEEEERDQELQKVKAKETLKQVKLEMGQLYSEIERHANSIRVDKTIGSPGTKSSEDENESKSSKK